MDDDELQELEGLVAGSFPVYESRYDPLEGVAVFLVTVDEERLSGEFSELKSRLEDRGYIPMLRQESGEHVIYVVEAPDDDYTREWVNAALFLATVVTTILAGALIVHRYENPAQCGFDASLAAMLSPGFLGRGALFFALPLVGILGVHELGHYFTAKLHDVEASLPFFIPIPPLIGVPIGTMGAFISIRRPITDRKALLDIGIAGPLAGLVVAIPVVVAGAALSAAQPQYVPDEQLSTPAGAAAVWTGDHVVIAGGELNGPTDGIARYDPGRDHMVTLDDKMPVHVQDAGSAWTGSAAYVVGGQGQSQTRTEIVRVAADGRATTTGAELPSGRADLSAVWTGDAVLAFGGRVGDGLYTDEIVRYDPGSGDVTTLDLSLPTARGGTSAVWTGDVAYVIGGTDGAALADVVRVDPDAGTVEVVAELPSNVTGTSAVWTGDAAVVFGGAGPGNASRIVSFTPSTGSAEVVGSLPSPRTRTAAVWTGEAAYIFGGVNATGAVQHQIVRFDPSTDEPAVMQGALPEECRDSFVQLGGPIFGGFGGPEVQGLLFNVLTAPFETDSSAIIHTTAFAGWVGLLVTGLNLLPAGQLDGGHIFRAFLGEKHKYASLGAVGVLLFFGAVGFGGWLIFALLVIVLGTYHPPPLNDLTPLSPSRKVLAVLALVILVLTFVPIPFYFPGG